MGATLPCGAWASHCGGFSCGARALGTRASVVVAHGLSNCGARAQLLRGMWDLPGPRLEPVSHALAGGFLTTVPPGKPLFLNLSQDTKYFLSPYLWDVTFIHNGGKAVSVLLSQCFVQSHMANKWCRQNLNPDNLASKF